MEKFEAALPGGLNLFVETKFPFVKPSLLISSEWAQTAIAVANLERMEGMTESEQFTRDDFLEAHKRFADKHKLVIEIFALVSRKNDTERRSWANRLFFRLGMVSTSILKLCEPELENTEEFSALDHTSNAALGRTLLEAWIMFMYLSDPAISEEEWGLRRAILELHDSIARYRWMKDTGDQQEAQGFKPQIELLKNIISSEPTFRGLDRENQDKILAGKQLYIKGLRGAVRATGWDADQFYAIYNILSSHSHSAPLSFYRDEGNPYEPVIGIVPSYVYLISELALDHCVVPLGLACERMMFELYPELFLKGTVRQ